ncbi:MAG: hypothetical protein U1F76_20490 [Candidatus Competibacteraceae bacterium]
MRVSFLFVIMLFTGCASQPEKLPEPPPVVIPAAAPTVAHYRLDERWLGGKRGGAAWQGAGYAYVLWWEELLPLKAAGNEPAALAARPPTPLAKSPVELPVVELISTQPRSCPP